MKLGLMPAALPHAVFTVWSYKQDEAQGHSRELVTKGSGGRSKDDPGEVYSG